MNDKIQLYTEAGAIEVWLLVYGREFKRLWLEPVLRYPVVIFESDDRGAAPKIRPLH